jgi:hypothetical protein
MREGASASFNKTSPAEAVFRKQRQPSEVHAGGLSHGHSIRGMGPQGL